MAFESGKVSLERALSKLGTASRRQTREWILDGRLQVNGRVIKDPMFPVRPESDLFTVDGEPVVKDSWMAIMLNKPRAVVTTRSDEKGRRTVFDLLPAEMGCLHPVGRLDMASTGLLIMTNDTRLSAYLTDPVNTIPRVYTITVRGAVTEEELERARAGILDAGELLKPTDLTIRKTSGRESHLTVTLTEGKNRELRRLFEAIGHEVTHLKRIAFGGLTLGDLQPGSYKPLRREDFGPLPWSGKPAARGSVRKNHPFATRLDRSLALPSAAHAMFGLTRTGLNPSLPRSPPPTTALFLGKR